MSNNSQGKGDEAMSGEVDYEVMRAVRSIGMTAPKNQFFLQVTEELIRAVEARHDGLIACRLRRQRPCTSNTHLTLI